MSSQLESLIESVGDRVKSARPQWDPGGDHIRVRRSAIWDGANPNVFRKVLVKWDASEKPAWWAASLSDRPRAIAAQASWIRNQTM